MHFGGGIPCDRLKQPILGKEYYDTVIHFVEVKMHLLTGSIEVAIQNFVLLLMEHSRP